MNRKTKVCFKCQAAKSLEEFYRHPAMADGRLNKCKECTKLDVRENYVKHIEYFREYERRRSHLPDRRVQATTYRQKRRSVNRVKFVASYLTTNAIRDGRLIRQPCESCGATENIQAHHDDYSKPLEVRWLCFVCHRKVHGQLCYTEPLSRVNN